MWGKVHGVPEYKREKDRLHTVDTENEEAAHENERQERLKLEVRRLRNQARQMQFFVKKQTQSDHEMEARSRPPKVEDRRNST